MDKDDLEMVRALAATLVLPQLIQDYRQRAYGGPPDDLERSRLASLAVEYADQLVERLATPPGEEAPNV